MNLKLTAASILALTMAREAHAQTVVAPVDRPEPQKPDVPVNALEITGAVGYTQGFGEIVDGLNVNKVITAGLGTELGLNYRFSPHLALGVYGQYNQFDAQRTDTARGLAAGLGLTYHILPFEHWDPWLQFATGYRMLWETGPSDSNTPTVMTHGFEPARLTVGLDYRVSRDIAISPQAGIDLSVPAWQTVNGNTTALNDPRPSTYVFAGMGVRFDLTSKYVHQTTPPAELPETTQARVTPPPETKPVSPTISASDEVLAACKLAIDNADSAPHFEFDKSDLMPQDLEVLSKIAECFSTGPLKNDNMQLIGRADPRGSTEYNDALGMRRADTVAKFLTEHGIGTGRIEKTSRGERDATGTDEASYAKDRRVDVLRVEIRLSKR
ncbi:MAG TPA: OmpA family protein [Polyangiaceae bacterium]|jgi:peptidoglycan-associated lipoprotein